MEDFKKKSGMDNGDKEIVFSKSIKAGKRIYYLDVKKNRKRELFLAITESKKVITGEGENIHVNFEKHKIFLYKEDFEKFVNGLQETISFINENQKPLGNEVTGVVPENAEELGVVLIEELKTTDIAGEIKIDIDFE